MPDFAEHEGAPLCRNNIQHAPALNVSRMCRASLAALLLGSLALIAATSAQRVCRGAPRAVFTKAVGSEIVLKVAVASPGQGSEFDRDFGLEKCYALVKGIVHIFKDVKDGKVIDDPKLQTDIGKTLSAVGVLCTSVTLATGMSGISLACGAVTVFASGLEAWGDEGLKATTRVFNAMEKGFEKTARAIKQSTEELKLEMKMNTAQILQRVADPKREYVQDKLGDQEAKMDEVKDLYEFYVINKHLSKARCVSSLRLISTLKASFSSRKFTDLIKKLMQAQSKVSLLVSSFLAARSRLFTIHMYCCALTGCTRVQHKNLASSLYGDMVSFNKTLYDTGLLPASGGCQDAGRANHLLETTSQRFPISQQYLELSKYEQITDGEKKWCALSSLISGKPRQCLHETSTAALACCSEACTADGTCDGLWWQPQSNSNCILFRDCSTQENATFPGCIYRKLDEVRNYKQITDSEKRRCARSSHLSEKPRQCLHKTGSAALACCSEACIADWTCTACCLYSYSDGQNVRIG